MRTLYSALWYLLSPLILLRLLLRSRRLPAYRQRLAERLGFLPETFAAPAGAIWVHAVSVGEVQACRALVEALLKEYPERGVVVTTTTPTGSQRVRELYGERVAHAYLPWDLPGAVGRFLDRVRPAVLLLVETELWPNLLHASRRRGCHCLLLSARLSEASARRYGYVAPFTQQTLSELTHIACQTRDDAGRFVALGADPERVTVTGSLKYDGALTEEERSQSRRLCAELGLSGRPLWVAASTHPAEEPLVLEALAQVRASYPELLLLLAPRHPERAVVDHCEQRGLSCVRRSAGVPPGADTAVLLLDSMGELPLIFGAAQLAFIGGSLVAAGGHNPLEAVRWGVPVISGPRVDNFIDVYRRLQRAGAALEVSSAQALADTVIDCLRRDGRRARMGAAGQRVMLVNAGAGERTLALLRDCLR